MPADKGNMADSSLSQSVADYLLAMLKYLADDQGTIEFCPGMHVGVELVSRNRQELFRLIIERKARKISHAKYQTMVRKSIILVRLEIDGPPHKNPDKSIVPCPHIHVYREGFGTAWAYPVTDEFGDTANLMECLQDFMRYCNIAQRPRIREVRGLIS